MNIKITYNWLREYLETEADASQMGKYLSLCGASIEHVIKTDDDWVFDVEITSNRIDMASVWGVAQEAAAILPRFGKKAHLLQNPLQAIQPISEAPSDAVPFTLTVENEALMPHAVAVVYDLEQVELPNHMKKRLEVCDIRSVSPLVDITNYIMLSIGQPTHVFDYDRLEGNTLHIRESKKGETVTTLDGKTYTLPGGDIVGVDGSGAIVDLCGIMGGKSSAVNAQTKRAVFFVQTYNKRRIRTTSMKTGARSVAAAYFEKGLDEARVDAAVALGNALFLTHTHAHVRTICVVGEASVKPTQIDVAHDFIVKRIGVDVSTDDCVSILTGLGFTVRSNDSHVFTITVPPWRKHDVEIPEDIVEEVARVYGYHNLPGILPPPAFVSQPKEIEHLLKYQSLLRKRIKHLGYHESINYSMTSREMLSWLDFDPAHHLELEETMSQDWKYMRTSLLPSLLANLRENAGRRHTLKFFEIAKVYYPVVNDLPKEVYKVALATNTSFEDIKGEIEAILAEMNIVDWQYQKSNVAFFTQGQQVHITYKDCIVATVGQVRKKNALAAGMKFDIYMASLDLQALIERAKTIPNYRPINPFASIKLDVTLDTAGRTYAEILKIINDSSPKVEQVHYLSSFKTSVTVRITMNRNDANMTEQEAQEELKKIQEALAAA